MILQLIDTMIITKVIDDANHEKMIKENNHILHIHILKKNKKDINYH